MKYLAKLFITLILLTSCTAMTSELTPTVSFTATEAVTVSPTLEPTQTETVTQTLTKAPTEEPRFERLIWPTIKEVMDNNILDISSPEKISSEVALLREKMMANVPAPEDCPTYKVETYDGTPAKGAMDVSGIIIENPQVAVTAHSKEGDREFLSLGMWLKDRYDPKKCLPIIFTFDVDVIQTPPYQITGADSIANWHDTHNPYHDNESIYKKLINGEVKEMKIIVCKTKASEVEGAVDKNLLWLFNQQYNLDIPIENNFKFTNEYVNMTKLEWFLNWFGMRRLVTPKENEDWFKDAVNSFDAVSYYLLASRYLIINSYK